MKSGLFVVLAALLVSEMGVAQMPSIRESEVVQTGSVWEEVVKNLSGSSIVALHATFHCIDASGRHVTDENGSTDSLFSFSHDRNIPPGGSYVIHEQGDQQCTGGADAAIFADGHSEGDSATITRIYDLRRGAFKGLAFIIPLFESIASGEMTSQNAIAILSKRAKSTAIDMTRSVEDRIGENWPYNIALGALRRQNTFSTPSSFTSSRQPRIDALAKETNISREQAVAIVNMNKFKEWQAALLGNTEPPAGN
jgi:hypothetical protein